MCISELSEDTMTVQAKLMDILLHQGQYQEVATRITIRRVISPEKIHGSIPDGESMFRSRELYPKYHLNLRSEILQIAHSQLEHRH